MADQSRSPLAGKRVVITRAQAQSAGLIQALEANGAEVTSLALIRIAPPRDFAALDCALRSLDRFDRLIFTSPNAVTAVSSRFAAVHGSHPDKSGPAPIAAIAGEASNAPAFSQSLHVAAVGRATADAARAAGFLVTHIGTSTAAELVGDLASSLGNQRVLLPRSDRAAASLVTQLNACGAQVTEVIAYRTIFCDSVEENKRREVATGDAFLFFSPSAVQAFLRLTRSGVLSSIRNDAVIGAVGPVTRAALGQAGLRCDIAAPEPGVNEIVAAVIAHFERRRVSSASGVHSR